jgi:hypothetical protein
VSIVRKQLITHFTATEHLRESPIIIVFALPAARNDGRMDFGFRRYADYVLRVQFAR